MPKKRKAKELNDANNNNNNNDNNSEAAIEKKVKLQEKFEKLPDPLKKIFEFARQKNCKGLDELINSGICINSTYCDDQVIAMLAENNDVDAVNFLIENYGAIPKFAAEGYARSGNLKEKTNLIKHATPEESFEIKMYTLRGLGQGKHIDVAQKLIDEEQDARKKHMLQRWFIFGLGKAGEVDEIEKQIKKEKYHSRGWALKQWAAIGFAQGGHIESLAMLIQREPSSAIRSRLYTDSIPCLIRNGFTEEAKHLIAKAKELFGEFTTNLLLVGGFAQKGCLTEVNNIINKITDPDERLNLTKCAVQWFAQSGYVNEAYSFIANESLKNERFELLQPAVTGFGIGGHFAEIQKIIKEEPDLNRRQILRENAAWGLGFLGFHDQACKLIKDHETDLLNAKKKRTKQPLNYIKQNMIAGLAECGCHFYDVVRNTIGKASGQNRGCFTELCKASMQGLGTGQNLIEALDWMVDEKLNTHCSFLDMVTHSLTLFINGNLENLVQVILFIEEKLPQQLKKYVEELRKLEVCLISNARINNPSLPPQADILKLAQTRLRYPLHSTHQAERLINPTLDYSERRCLFWGEQRRNQLTWEQGAPTRLLNDLPTELFIHVCSFILKCSNYDARIILDALSQTVPPKENEVQNRMAP